MKPDQFETIWQLHQKWNLGILTKEIRKLKTANIVLGYTSDEYFNIAIPNVENPTLLNLEEIKETLSPINNKASIYLLEKHQRDFPEYLVRHGYTLESRDTWMILNPNLVEVDFSKMGIVKVTPQNFNDYYQVLHAVFNDWPGNEEYLEICRNSLTAELNSQVKDLKSEFFVIYKDGKPVAGAGLFFSREENVAYFHNDGTLEDFRGQGYHTLLVEHRVQKLLRNGINRVYAIVEHGTQSWRNYIKCNFNQVQVANLFVLK